MEALILKNIFIPALLIYVAFFTYPAWSRDNFKFVIPADSTIAGNTNFDTASASELASTDPSQSAVLKGPNEIVTTSTNNVVPASGQNNKASLPKKAISIATAFVVGTPVCILRRTKYEEKYAINGWLAGSTNKYKKVLAGIISLPMAAVCGLGEAPCDAIANGIMYPAFSKDQLSQGKLIQNN